MTDQIVSAPSHAAAPAPQWWRHAVIYQIYPRSFADSNGDGMGDLPGITSRLPYLAELGIDAIWISPFYPSPQADAGYDVADYLDVDPRFGALSDADQLISTAHELGLRVLVDLVPNHTSDEHAWFQAALAAAPGSPERARYWFVDSEGLPNNWSSEFGGPAWSRTPDGQWYLHLFDSKQPDLNWENHEVRTMFTDTLRFWLDRGVDGFRVDVAHGLIKADGLPDFHGNFTDLISGLIPTNTAPFYDQDRVHEIYRDWRTVLNSYPDDRAMVAEAWVKPLDRLARYVRPDEFHQAFNFTYLLTGWDAAALTGAIAASLDQNGAVGAPTTWVLSNHDVVRHATRLALETDTRSPRIDSRLPTADLALGLKRARAATTLMLALPGSAYLYQGEELGLPEVFDLPDSVRQDPTFRRTGGKIIGRDGCRVPIPWQQDAPAYGFGPLEASWLPQPEIFGELAVDQQAGRPESTLELYRTLLRLRRERGLGTGSPRIVRSAPNILAMEISGEAGTTHVMVNLGTESWPLPADAQILVASQPGITGLLGPDQAVWYAL